MRTAAVVLATLVLGCSMCENEIVQIVPSPSGKLEAVVFHRGCGATVGFNTQVSVLVANTRLPDEGGNTLIVDDKVPMVVAWRSDKEVTIRAPTAGQVYKREAEVAGVWVSYGQ